MQYKSIQTIFLLDEILGANDKNEEKTNDENTANVYDKSDDEIEFVDEELRNTDEGFQFDTKDFN